MARNFWREDEEQLLREMVSQRYSYADIARSLGRSIDSVMNKAERTGATLRGAAINPPSPKVAHEVPASQDPDSEKLKAENAALRFKIEDQEKTQRAPVSGYTIEKYIDPETAAEKWKRAETENAHRIEISKQKRDFTVNFDDDWVMIAVMSDLHIAPGTPVDMRRMREDAELIRRTDRCFAVIGGDVVDNHIKHRSAVMAARSQPSDQWEHFEYLFEIMAPKVCCAVAGNHDLWTDQIGGIDVLGRILANHQNTGYSNNEARIVMNVGSQAYDFAVRHQYRMNSSFNQTHAVKQWLRLGEQDFDIGIVGHHHEAAIENFMYKGEMRWAARPGAYQITSSYSAQYGWNDAVPTCPTFVLRGDSRKIYGFPDIRDAIEFRSMKG